MTVEQVERLIDEKVTSVMDSDTLSKLEKVSTVIDNDTLSKLEKANCLQQRFAPALVDEHEAVLK